MLWEALSLPWRGCLDEAWAAYRSGSIPIGATITDDTGTIVSRGRNRIFEAGPISPFLAGHRLAHAEMNALVALDYSQVDPRDCTIYTTTEPCPLCIGAIRMARLREVRYAARDTVAGSVALLDATPFMRRNIRVHGPEREDLEAIIVALHVEFSLRTDLIDGELFVRKWEPDLPLGVRLGRMLHETGDLQRLSLAATPAVEMVRQLEAML